VSKHRDLPFGSPLPTSFLRAAQELLSTFRSPLFRPLPISPTTLRLLAGANDAQVGLAINGRWRYVTANVDATHPGGAAGNYNLWATAADNVFAASGAPEGEDPEDDNTDYSFALTILPTGSTPATALHEIVGTVGWSGTTITGVLLTGERTGDTGQVASFAGSIPPGWLLCDGSQKLAADYPALAAYLGTTWGSAAAGSFTLPSLAGRTLVGVGADPSASDAVAARALAATGGLSQIRLAEVHLPNHWHAYSGTPAGRTPSTPISTRCAASCGRRWSTSTGARTVTVWLSDGNNDTITGGGEPSSTTTATAGSRARGAAAGRTRTCPRGRACTTASTSSGGGVEC
jgi:microcystin-dependent protein